LHVDDGGLGSDGNGLCDRADLHFCIDRGRKVGGEFDAIALDRIEASQGEGDAVRTWSESNDLVLPSPVRDRCSGFLNQCRTGYFDGRAG
jgi:hypothetical protein